MSSSSISFLWARDFSSMSSDSVSPMAASSCSNSVRVWRLAEALESSAVRSCSASVWRWAICLCCSPAVRAASSAAFSFSLSRSLISEALPSRSCAS
ncbi:hypothetical protein D3C80_974920 [compost metagenome]